MLESGPVLDRFSQPSIAGFGSRFVGPATFATVLFADDAAEQRWGLLSAWRDRDGQRPPPIRLAALETLALVPVLRKATRCLVPASAVLAKTLDGPKSHRWNLAAGVDDMFLAAVSSTNDDDGVPSFALVTVPAPAAIAVYTDVIPLLADEHWLAGGEPIEKPWRLLDWGSRPPDELY